MDAQTFIDSVAYRTERLLEQIAELNEGRRRVFCNGEDVSAREADELTHCVIENITIMDRLRALRGASSAANARAAPPTAATAATSRKHGFRSRRTRPCASVLCRPSPGAHLQSIFMAPVTARRR